MINKLSDTHIRKAVFPDTKSLSDGKGLRVVLTATAKSFQFRYQRPITKKINNIVIGHYPATTLKSARETAQKYRDFLLEGIDPQYAKTASSITFSVLAEQYFKKNKADWSKKHYETTYKRYVNYIERPFASRDIRHISPHDIYTLLEYVAQSGSYGTAEKLSYIFNGCFDQAIVLGQLMYSPSLRVMQQVTVTTKSKSMPHFNLTKKGEGERFAKFLNDIQGLKRTSISIKSALLIAPHLFMRSGELSALKLDNYDKENKCLVIDAKDMKRNHSDFIVPLSTQAQEIIDNLIEVTNPDKWLFQSPHTKTKHISQESISKAKQRLGWKYEDATIHGLRHTATTYLTENGFDYEVTEMQLHHKLTGVRGVYNKAVHLEERRRMMQAWSDYITSKLE